MNVSPQLCYVIGYVFTVFCIMKAFFKKEEVIFLLNILAVKMNIFNGFFLDVCDDEDNDTDKKVDVVEVEVESKPEVKYEDKYLDDIKKLDAHFTLNEEDKREQVNIFLELYDSMMTEYTDKLNETNSKLETTNVHDDKTALQKYKDELTYYCTSIEGLDQFTHRVVELSREKLINNKLKALANSLANCYVMEHTPLGNVLMTYNAERETFTYYSDSSMPYRYLEVVARKFVKQFQCRPIFVDMEEEIKLSEKKWDEEKEKAEKKRQMEADAEAKVQASLQTVTATATATDKKKPVFAKFKSYNREAGTGHVSVAPPPKNNIPNKSVTPEDRKIILKEKTNRYTYEGKLANFSFLKKIDKKLVNKKLSLNFADFKKAMINDKSEPAFDFLFR